MTNFNFDFLKGTFICSFFFYLTTSFSVQSQELYDMESITEIKIYFSQNNWDQLLDQYYLNEMDERLIADSVLINGSMKDSVGVKYKGNSTFNENNAKNPINIALDYVHNNQDYQGFRTLKLSSGQKDPSFLREVLSYEVARKYMQAPLSNFARVYINGNYHGLYSSSESINKDFQRNYLYADNNNTRIKCNPVSVFNGGSSLVYLGNDSASYYDYYELKSDYGWQDLIDLTNEINNSPENIENHLDIDRAIWMMAFNNVLVNLDSYIGPFKQNYYLIKDNNDRMNSVIWDLNESFGGFAMVGGSEPPNTDLATIDPLLREGDADWPLLNLIFSNPTYKRMYLAHMRTIVTENFSNNWYKDRALELQNLINDAAQSDQNSFYSYNNFIDNLNSDVNVGGGGPGGGNVVGIVSLMDERASYLLQQPVLTESLPQINDISNSPEVVDYYSTPTILAEVQNANSVTLAYRFRPQDRFTKIEMYDDGMHNDGQAGDNVYGIEINVDARDVQFYIYAENNTSGMFSPEKAEHEYHQLAVTGTVLINEIMTSNSSSVADMSSGVAEYDDWVELYNRGLTAVDLEGYFLTDNENILNKWAFPSVSIQPDEYLVIWLDGDDGIQDGLHTNFRLDNGGEEIYLSTPNLNTIDALYFQNIAENMGYARLPNGTGPFVQQAHTFEANNGNSSNIFSETIEQWRIYPNPATNKITLETNQRGMLEVLSLLGQSCLHMNINSNKTNIDLSQLSHGVYLFKLNNEIKKIIVQ